MKRIWAISVVMAAVGLSRALFAQSTDPSNALFDDTVLQEIRLSVNTTDWALIKANWQIEIKVPADFRWNGQVVRNTSIHARGQGSRRPQKLSLHIEFDDYTAGQTFLGLHGVILRNNSQDPSSLRETLCMKLFNALGVPTSREAHARLFVNNHYEGLYTMVEVLDEAFLKKNFNENTGHLYEYEFDNQAVLAGATPFVFQFLGSDPAKYVPDLFKPKTLKDDPQGEAFARFTQAVGDTGSPNWRSNVSAFTDLAKFIRHLAIENFLAEEDGLSGDYGPNNFYIYRFANTNTFQFIPWDKSESFFDVNYSIFRNINDGDPSRRDLLTVRALQEPDLYQLYLDTLVEASNFAIQGAAPDGTPGWLEAEVNREYDQVRADALQDTLLFTNDVFEQAVADLGNFARTRSSIVFNQVAAAPRVQ